MNMLHEIYQLSVQVIFMYSYACTVKPLLSDTQWDLRIMLDYLGGCWIMECLLPYLCMVTVPHIMVRLERMSDYRGIGLERFHCIIDSD